MGDFAQRGQDIKGGVKNSKVAAASRNQEMSVGSRASGSPHFQHSFGQSFMEYLC